MRAAVPSTADPPHHRGRGKPLPLAIMKQVSSKQRGELRKHRVTWGAVVARDGGRCIKCGAEAVSVHEIVRRSAFGLDKSQCFTVRNMCCVCSECDADSASPYVRGEMLRVLRDRHGYTYEDEPWRWYVDGIRGG